LASRPSGGKLAPERRKESLIVRILVLGAGAIGGYFGGRLAAAGVDVTFLVRPRRAAELARTGLVIKSPLGDAAVAVKTVQREAVGPGWDGIVVACKAYDLEDAIAALRPAAPGALIVPQLNGIRHLATLDAAFGAENVAGGLTQISLTVDPDGAVHHLAPMQRWAHGPRLPAQQARSEALQAAFAQGGFGSVLSGNIVLEMWEKWCFLCALAVMSCLMRAGVGPIARTRDGAALMLEVFDDCIAAATAAGYAPRPDFVARTQKMLTDPDTAFAASMLRDVQKGGPVEADHIVGDMLEHVRALNRPATLLRAAYALLQVYQAQRS
jgi:2-dehydropantoate 2-reductase